MHDERNLENNVWIGVRNLHGRRHLYVAAERLMVAWVRKSIVNVAPVVKACSIHHQPEGLETNQPRAERRGEAASVALGTMRQPNSDH